MKRLGGVRCVLAVAGSLVAGLAWMPAAVAQERRLTAADGAAGDEFGHSVAVQGTTAVVGAPFADDGRGAAYVFTQVGDEWTQTAS
ncbi:MAG: FG-GAP repeat protein [Thermoleophilia bacterium]